MLHFLSDKVSSLSIRFFEPKALRLADLAALVHCLRDARLPITRLEIGPCGYAWDVDIDDDIFTKFSEIAGVVMLYADTLMNLCINIYVFLALLSKSVRFSTLESIEIFGNTFDCPSPSTETHPLVSLPSLRRLVLRGELDVLTPWLSACEGTAITVITIPQVGMQPLSDVFSFLAAIGHGCSEVTTIRLHNLELCGWDLKVSPLLEQIRPLLECDSLETFHVTSHLSVFLSDDDIAKMALAWHFLKTLYFELTGGDEDKTTLPR
jgi:hypothetical protein